MMRVYHPALLGGVALLLGACGAYGDALVVTPMAGQVGVRVVEQRPWDHVLVLQSTRIDCPAEVVGLLDVHAPAPGLDSALDELRRRALALGADAVLGVEFRHGHTENDEPLHLSGLGVRCIGPAS